MAPRLVWYWMLLALIVISLSTFSSCHAVNDTARDITSEAVDDLSPWPTLAGDNPGHQLTPKDWNNVSTIVTASPTGDAPARSNVSLVSNAGTVSRRAPRPRQTPPTLRIMPLGASITAGVHSKPMDGYRKHLRNWLRQAGIPVNMVGSQDNPSGSMKNGAHEGFPGLRISQVRDKLAQDGWLNHKPNVVLVHLGTNNCVQNVDVEEGANDLRDLILDIIDHVKGVHVILSTLGPLHDPAYQHRCQNVLNPRIRALFHDLHRLNYSVSLVDFGDPNGYITPTDINNDDGIHPTEAGYVKYATLWYYAVMEAYHAGHITAPEKTGFPDKSGPGGGGNQAGVDDADTFTEHGVPSDPRKDHGES